MLFYYSATHTLQHRIHNVGVALQCIVLRFFDNISPSVPSHSTDSCILLIIQMVPLRCKFRVQCYRHLAEQLRISKRILRQYL
jgi:hypothetical protein